MGLGWLSQFFWVWAGFVGVFVGWVGVCLCGFWWRSGGGVSLFRVSGADVVGVDEFEDWLARVDGLGFGRGVEVSVFFVADGGGGVVRGLAVGGRRCRDADVVAGLVAEACGVLFVPWDGGLLGEVVAGCGGSVRWLRRSDLLGGVAADVRPGVWVSGLLEGLSSGRGVLVCSVRGCSGGERDRLKSFVAWRLRRVGDTSMSISSRGGRDVFDAVDRLLVGRVGWVGFGGDELAGRWSGVPGGFVRWGSGVRRGGWFGVGLLLLGLLGGLVGGWVAGWVVLVLGVVWLLLGGRVLGSRFRGWLCSGSLVCPGRFRWFPVWQLLGVLNSFRDSSPLEDDSRDAAVGQVREAFPWDRFVVPVSLRVFGELLCPAGGSTAVVEVVDRVGVSAPVGVVGGRGCVVGVDDSGRRVCVPWGQRQGGLVALGEPRTGKSTSLLVAALSECFARVDPVGWGFVDSGGVAFRGVTTCWLEAKSDGDARLGRVLLSCGYRANVGVDDPRGFVWVRLGDRSSAGVLWLDRSSPAVSAGRFVDAMMYAWNRGGDRAIAASSKNALVVLFRAVLAAPDGLWDVWCERYGGVNAVRVVAELMSSVKATSERVWSELVSFAGEDPESEFAGFVRSVAEFFGDRGASSRTQLFDAPLNKLSDLGAAIDEFTERDGMWRFEDLVTGFRPVLVNTRGSVAGGWPETVSQTMASMFLSLLWEQVKVSCGDWYAERKVFSFYCDELALVAGGGQTEIIAAMREEGGSRGVWLGVGVQRLTQLDATPLTLAAVEGCAHRLVFQTSGPDAVTRVDRLLNLGVGEPVFGVPEITGLPQFTGLARLHDGTALTPVFRVSTVRDENWVGVLAGES